MGVACTEERPVMHWVRNKIPSVFVLLYLYFMELMNNQQILYCVEAINKK